MKTIKDIPNLKGVKVMLWADFNVPVVDGKIVDDYRIRMAFPTLNYLLEHKAKVVICSHIESTADKSLRIVAKHINKLGIRTEFIPTYKAIFAKVESMNEGECVLLENIRSQDGEKKNDPKFAKELASIVDIYVNDAFSVSHREHASVVGVPKLIPGYAGFQVEKEVANLSQAFNPQHPFLFILGGAKFDTKMPLLSRFDEIADKIFVGGALANDIFVAKGQEVGRSTVSSTKLDLSHFITDPKITLPVDVLLDDKRTILVGEVGPQDRIMDSGPQTLKNLQAEISKAKFILWNGPLGLYEDGYRGTTLDLAKSISEMTAKGTTTIVGGGDTLAAIASLGIGEDFTFVSTAGGAMLDYLAKGTLPGLEVLNG